LKGHSELPADGSSHHTLGLNKVRKEGEHIYATSIPVSDAQRDGLRAAEESDPALLDKAGLAGANILFLFIRLGVDLEELAFVAFSNSFVEYKHLHIIEYSEYTHHSCASSLS